MGGTYYRSPAPGEPPFIREGDKVTKGQTICIIEAMKLMNEIEVQSISEFCFISRRLRHYGVVHYVDPNGDIAEQCLVAVGQGKTDGCSIDGSWCVDTGGSWRHCDEADRRQWNACHPRPIPSRNQAVRLALMRV